MPRLRSVKVEPESVLWYRPFVVATSMRPDTCGSSANEESSGAPSASPNTQLSPLSVLRIECAISVVATALLVETRSYSTQYAGATVTTFQVAPKSVDSLTPTLVAASTRFGAPVLTV